MIPGSVAAPKLEDPSLLLEFVAGLCENVRIYALIGRASVRDFLFESAGDRDVVVTEDVGQPALTDL